MRRQTIGRIMAVLVLLALGPVLASAFAPAPTGLGLGLGPEEKLRVVATTTIVGDVVRQVGGETIALTVLLPPGVDPHSYEPTPQDIVAMTEAELIFINGAGLEANLERLLRKVAVEAKVEVVSVSEGVEIRRLGEGEDGDLDPHVWFDPQNVLIWVENIEGKLAELDPVNAELYAAAARSYKAALRGLDDWILEQVERIPREQRKLVTDHLFLGYFAERYGFNYLGAIFPGLSTLAEPSAGELAELIEIIRREEVRAIFVGMTVNPALAEQIAADTGVELVFLYTGSLSGPSGPADTYLKLMQYDVLEIVRALE